MASKTAIAFIILGSFLLVMMMVLPSNIASQFTTSASSAVNESLGSQVLGEQTIYQGYVTYSVIGGSTSYYTTGTQTSYTVTGGTTSYYTTQTTNVVTSYTFYSTTSTGTTTTQPASLIVTIFGNFGMYDSGGGPVQETPLELFGLIPYGLIPIGGGREVKQVGYDINYKVEGSNNIDWSTLQVVYQAASVSSQGSLIVGSIPSVDGGLKAERSGKLSILKIPVADLLSVPVDSLDKTKPLQVALSIMAIASAFPIGAEQTADNLVTAVSNPVTAVGTLTWEQEQPVIIVPVPTSPTPTAPVVSAPTVPTLPTQECVQMHDIGCTTAGAASAGIVKTTMAASAGRSGAASVTGDGGRSFSNYGGRRHSLFSLPSSIEIYGAEVNTNHFWLLIVLCACLAGVGVVLHLKRDELEQ